MISLFGKNFCESCFAQSDKDPCEKCGFSAAEYQPDSTSLPVGHKLQERYLIGGVIGKGGFGITYTAFDTKLERRVAIKEYYPYGIASRAPGATMVSTSGIGDESDDVFSKGAEKFYEEARLVAKFSDNQNIVSIYDFFYENSTVYYVMEFLQGQSLKNYIAKHGVVSPEQAVFIAKEVSNALVSAHSANILHRDIAPDNIMLCSNGKIKLIDFGAARQVVTEGSQSLSIILKQGFAPLEQYQKKGKQGPWTDIYALGATVYYLITGDLLDDPMTRLDDDEEFSSNPHNLDEELWAIIKKATMLKPADRYKTVFEFRDELNKISIGEVPLTISYEEQPRFNRAASVEATAPAKEVPPVGATMPAKEAAPVGATMPAKEEASPIGATMPAKEEASPIGATMPAKEEASPIGATMPAKEEVASPIGATMPAKEAASPIGATMPAKEAASPIGATMPAKEEGASPMGVTMPMEEQPAQASRIFTDPDEGDDEKKSKSFAAFVEQRGKKIKLRLIVGLAAGVVIIVAIILGNIAAYRSTHVKIGRNWYSHSDQHVYETTVNISDISALSNLTELTGLTLRSDNISDISALSNLTELTYLILSDNNISDISALSNLTELTYLSLDDNNISDISALSNLTELTDLYLRNNNISDISALSNLTELKSLVLSDNDISDISALSNLTELTDLDLYNNNISDISALSNLTELTYLNLYGKNISDISALSNLTKLKTLFLTYNGEYHDFSSAEEIKAFLDKNVKTPETPDPGQPNNPEPSAPDPGQSNPNEPGTSELQRPSGTYLTYEEHCENLIKAYKEQLASISDAIGYTIDEMDGNGNPTYDLGNNYYEMIVLAGSDAKTDSRFEFYRYDDYRQTAIFMGQISASHASLVWDTKNGLCLYTPWNGYISEYRILLDGNKVTLEKDPVVNIKNTDTENMPNVFFREMTPKDDLSELTLEKLTDFGLGW